MTCLLQFIFVKHSNNFFAFEINNNMLMFEDSIFNFFYHKNIFRPTCLVSFFAKMFLYLDILTTSTILNLGSLSSIYWLELIYMFDFSSTGFILIVLWYVLLCLLCHLIYQYKDFLILQPRIYKFCSWRL